MSTFKTFVDSEAKKPKNNKNKTPRKKRNIKETRIKGPKKEQAPEEKEEEEEEEDDIWEVEHKTAQEIRNAAYKKALNDNMVINIDATGDATGIEKTRLEEKMRLKIYSIALRFFDTASNKNEDKFDSLQGLVNLEVDTISKYLQLRGKVFEISFYDNWDAHRENFFWEFFNDMLSTVEDNTELWTKIDHKRPLSEQYYRNGDLHGRFGLIWTTLKNNEYIHDWNSVSADEVFNKIKNDGRFATVFLMLETAFQWTGIDSTGVKHDNWKTFWNTKLSPSVFKFEKEYMNYTLGVQVSEIKNWFVRTKKLMLKTVITPYLQDEKVMYQLLKTFETPLDIQVYLRSHGELRNIHDFTIRFHKLIREKRTCERIYYQLKQEKKKNEVKAEQSAGCAIMLHNMKTIKI
jgi:hypothetical protein|tara:strand:+ start:1079 stop:2290 length:1212 start_codon:yes stop_codon:yes gene_type:complete